MKAEQYAARHMHCITLAQFFSDMNYMGFDYWRSDDGLWHYRSNLKVRDFAPVCDHPEDPVCTIQPTPNALEKVTRRTNKVATEEFDTREKALDILDKLLHE